jgi:hypothetical protein
MILKYSLNGSYRFIDSIDGFTISEKDDQIRPTKAMVCIERSIHATGQEEIFDLQLNESAFLLNDKGQTIERII